MIELELVRSRVGSIGGLLQSVVCGLLSVESILECMDGKADADRSVSTVPWSLIQSDDCEG